eukprot:TRINITY_DN289_c2_g1_i1.p1 TRINITY_DN289_c2_g1~~TRINITY_DN289_c2_g1_i1.p1  ORF type:complete len:403 (+),score=96.79 TRINITY_DN289_c2_g1_i1:38-1246(+)
MVSLKTEEILLDVFSGLGIAISFLIFLISTFQIFRLNCKIKHASSRQIFFLVLTSINSILRLIGFATILANKINLSAGIFGWGSTINLCLYISIIILWGEIFRQARTSDLAKIKLVKMKGNFVLIPLIVGLIGAQIFFTTLLISNPPDSCSLGDAFLLLYSLLALVFVFMFIFYSLYLRYKYRKVPIRSSLLNSRMKRIFLSSCICTFCFFCSTITSLLRVDEKDENSCNKPIFLIILSLLVEIAVSCSILWFALLIPTRTEMNPDSRNEPQENTNLLLHVSDSLLRSSSFRISDLSKSANNSNKIKAANKQIDQNISDNFITVDPTILAAASSRATSTRLSLTANAVTEVLGSSPVSFVSPSFTTSYYVNAPVTGQFKQSNENQNQNESEQLSTEISALRM